MKKMMKKMPSVASSSSSSFSFLVHAKSHSNNNNNSNSKRRKKTQNLITSGIRYNGPYHERGMIIAKLVFAAGP